MKRKMIMSAVWTFSNVPIVSVKAMLTRSDMIKF